MIKFLKESYIELTKVKWPSKDDTVRLTQYVIGVSFIVGLYITALDVMFKTGLGMLINR